MCPPKIGSYSLENFDIQKSYQLQKMYPPEIFIYDLQEKNTEEGSSGCPGDCKEEKKGKEPAPSQRSEAERGRRARRLPPAKSNCGGRGELLPPSRIQEANGGGELLWLPPMCAHAEGRKGAVRPSPSLPYLDRSRRGGGPCSTLPPKNAKEQGGPEMSPPPPLHQ